MNNLLWTANDVDNDRLGASLCTVRAVWRADELDEQHPPGLDSTRQAHVRQILREAKEASAKGCLLRWRVCFLVMS